MTLILNRVDMSFVNRVVHEYFDCVSGELMTAREVSELFRYSICVVLGLHTQITPKFQELSKLVVNHLKEVKGWPVLNSDKDKYNCLEIFVHAMEATRREVS